MHFVLLFLDNTSISEMSTATFKFTHINDRRGLFFWFGTDKYTKSYTNPMRLGTCDIYGLVDSIQTTKSISILLLLLLLLSL